MWSKLLTNAAIIWSVWFMVCLIMVGKNEFASRSMDSAIALQKYKEECVTLGGKVRHENSFLSGNVYYQADNGNESVFFYQSSFSVIELSLDLVQQLTLGLFDTSKLKSVLSKD
ncbi:hypothetical protein DDO73_13870 [Vibrio cholerae]|nr:hypothetical protein [Vibrio cholerae]